MESLFITGGTGFIGTHLVKLAVAAGYQSKVLVRSSASAEKVRAAGATPVVGDILLSGPWQQEALRAELIMHLAQPVTFGGRITKARAERYQTERLQMDRLLLSVLSPQNTKKILYVGGTSYYGDQGKSLATEERAPNSRGWGRFLAPAIEALQQDISRGLPVVQAFPGYIYGNGSWFPQFIWGALVKDRPFILLKEERRFASMMHVKDCARALLHLLQHGAPSNKYFVVDDEPCMSDTAYLEAARAFGATPKIREVPAWLCRVIMGDLLTESIQSDARLSNQKLRATNFTLEFPRVEVGVEDVVREMFDARRKLFV